MRFKYLVSLLTVLSLLFSTRGQCDLILTDVDVEAGTFTIEFLNTTSCGGTGGPDGVSEIQIGFQALDPDNDCAAMNQGWTFPSGITIPDDNNHPGWVFSSTSAEMPFSNWTNLWDDWPWDIDPPYYAGETITFPLYNQYQNDCSPGAFWANNLTCQLEDALNFWLDEGYSIQAVIWQISYGPTMYAEDGGWAEVGPNGDGTNTGVGIYDDENFLDNWVIIGPCAEESPGPDAVIGNVEFNVGCLDDTPIYNIDYTIYNYGDEEITDYCVEIWNEDYFQCYNGDLFNGGFGGYAIPPGEGQAFSTPFFEYEGIGSFFTMTVDSVNGTDEIVTGNNNTTVFYPEFPTCPTPGDTVFVELPPDTITFYDIDTIYITNTEYIIDTVEIETITYIYQIDSIFVTDTVTDTLYIELPPDTLILTEIDTIYIPWEWYIYDTVYVDNFIYDTTYIEVQLPPDTIIETVYDTLYWFYEDTLYITLPPDTVTITETELIYDTLYIDNYIYEYDTVYITETEYIVLTDTITEYIIQEILIDCNTGLPCGEEPPGIDCPDWTTIHIPNTFTPNNDGVNDVWQIKYDLYCWENIEFWVYNRWGNIVYHDYGSSFDSYPFWDGSMDNGDHYVADGVYVYLVKGKRIGRSEVVEAQGHVTIFR